MPGWKATNCVHVEADFESCHDLRRLKSPKVQGKWRQKSENQKALSTSFHEKIAKIASEIAKFASEIAKCRQREVECLIIRQSRSLPILLRRRKREKENL